jgi:hypothetical protein
LTSQEPAYVAETGLLLATETSLIMYFSCDQNEFHVDNELESAEPEASIIDMYCADKCKVTPPIKPEPAGDDLDSVKTEPDELSKKKKKKFLRVRKGSEKSLASRSRSKSPPRKTEPGSRAGNNALAMAIMMTSSATGVFSE